MEENSLDRAASAGHVSATHTERKAAAVDLTPDNLRDIDIAASKITVEGARYTEELEQMTGR